MSNVIYLRQRFEKMPVLSKSHICFASTRETLELQAAFSRIESPFLRRMIINIAREATSASREPQRIRLKLTHSSLRRLTMVWSASASSRSSGRDRATRLSRRLQLRHLRPHRRRLEECPLDHGLCPAFLSLDLLDLNRNPPAFRAMVLGIPGDSKDCPKRRMFIRTYGPTA